MHCLLHCHCVKSVQIRSFSGPYFPVFGLNTEIYSVSGNFSQCLFSNKVKYDAHSQIEKNCFQWELFEMFLVLHSLEIISKFFFLFSIIFCSEKFTKMGWFLRFTQPTFTCSTPMFLSIIFIVNFEQISHYFTRLLWLFHCWLWTGKFRLGTGNSWYFHWLENFWLPVNLKTQSFFRKVNWPKNSRNHDIFFAVVISKHETFTTHSSKT